MSLYLFDFGRFDDLSHVFDRKKLYNRCTENNDGSSPGKHGYSEPNSRDDETKDYVPPIRECCHRIPPGSNRRMSVPQLSRNESILKAREQRITSVVGIPHRHHITIAVNDEPVDIIKTTCTGPCLTACNANPQLRKTPSSKREKYQNNLYIDSDPRSKNKITNLLILTLVYVLSTICVRAILTLYTSIPGTNIIQGKVTLSLIYLFAAISIMGFSLNQYSSSMTQLLSRMKLIASLVLVLLWSGFYFIPTSSWVLSIFTAALLGIGISLFWSCHFHLLAKWSYGSLSCPQIQSLDTVRTRPNIKPITTVFSHSVHIWSNILIFTLLETLSTSMYFRKKSISKSDWTNNSSTERFENFTRFCGITNDYAKKGGHIYEADQTIFFLQCVCISLNIIALLLVLLLLDKSRSIRIPSNSLDKDSSHYMINSNSNQIATFPDFNDANEPIFVRLRKYAIRNGMDKISVVVSLWRFQKMRYVWPSLLTMGLLEGFFVTDFNERFTSCAGKTSFIGLSMLTFALGPVIFVNIFQLIIKYPLLETITTPLSRSLIIVSSLVLTLTNYGYHWTFLIILYPLVVSLDAVLCLQIFYVNMVDVEGSLADNSVVMHRILRLLGTSIYILMSATSGSFSAAVFAAVAHCFLSPAILGLAQLFKHDKA